MIYTDGIEYAASTDIKAYQEERLRDLLSYISENSPFYSRMFKERGVDYTSIKTLEDLHKLPVTTARKIYRGIMKSFYVSMVRK